VFAKQKKEKKIKRFRLYYFTKMKDGRPLIDRVLADLCQGVWRR